MSIFGHVISWHDKPLFDLDIIIENGETYADDIAELADITCNICGVKMAKNWSSGICIHCD